MGPKDGVPMYVLCMYVVQRAHAWLQTPVTSWLAVSSSLEVKLARRQDLSSNVWNEQIKEKASVSGTAIYTCTLPESDYLLSAILWNVITAKKCSRCQSPV